MPDYTVRDGSRLAIKCHVYEAGQTVTLDAAQGDGLVESGVLEPAKAKTKSRHSFVDDKGSKGDES